MEMTADTIPQEPQTEQVQEEEKGWLTIEEKEKLINELDAFEDAGGKLEDFVTSKGISKWTLMRYRKQVNQHNKKSKSAREKYKEARMLVSGGMNVTDACKRAGLSLGYYYQLKSQTQREAAKKYQPRKIKEMPAVSDDSYNKTLRARIVALERLVVELTLDRQALIEAREGAI